MTINISNSINNRMGRVDSFSSQPRTYGPLLGLLLANLISRVVSAKYPPFLGFPFATYDPNPWLAYNKPVPVYPVHYPQWYPIKNPYPSIYQTHPTLTTEPSHHHETPPEHYVEHYDELHAEESQVVTTVENPISSEPVPEEASNLNLRVPYYRRRIPSKRRGSNKRRRTTPRPDYYDSYEDSYEYDYDYKPRRRPTTPRRRRTTTSAYDYGDDEDAKTEIIIVRQRQATTSGPTTLITSGTTEGPTSTTTESSNVNTTIVNNNATHEGYYGPSNGNEGISITYGPPYYYSAPYNNWYNHDTGNAVVRRVHDIVGAPEYYARKLRV